MRNKLKDSNDETLETLEDAIGEINYDLDNTIIDLPDNIDNNLNDEKIAKLNKPYRETFVIPIEYIIRIEENDRS